MLRIFSAAILLTFCAPAFAQQQQQSEPRPIADSTTGSWESVVWGTGRRVHHCTLIHVNVPGGDPGYGLLVDSQGTLLSVETAKWTLRREPTEVTVKPATGTERKVTAQPVTPKRANSDISKLPGMVAEFQRSEQVEVRIGEVSLRLPFDDFNAAWLVTNICVQRIGKDMPQTQR